jgi:hypothetical protein
MTAYRFIFLVGWLGTSSVLLDAQPAPQPAARPAEDVYVPEPVRPAEPKRAPEVTAAPGLTAAPTRPEIQNTPDLKSGGSGAQVTSAAASAPLSPRFQLIRDRIGALFDHRTEASPEFDAKRNPFRPAGAAPVAPVARPNSRPPESLPPAEADLALLKQIAATLKIAGTIEIQGRPHLSINQVLYKVGDVINARASAKGPPVFIRLKQITRYGYTLSYNGAELTVKF